MPFPSLDAAISKERILQGTQSEARSLRNYAQKTAEAMQTNRLSANAVTQVAQVMRGFINTLNVLIGTPGIEQYAINSIGRGVLDDAARLKKTCEAAIESVKPVFESDSKTGFIPLQKIEANGDVSTRSLSPAEMAPVRAALLEVLAAVE